jgi:hypothetical protein
VLRCVFVLSPIRNGPLNEKFPCSKLSTYLAHTVDEERSKAEWDGKLHRLKITMRIVRGDS